MEQPTESSQPTNSVVSSKTAAAPTPASAPTPPLLANQDEYVQRIDNTILAIEDQNLVHDERYAQLKLLKSKIIGIINLAFYIESDLNMFADVVLKFARKELKNLFNGWLISR